MSAYKKMKQDRQKLTAKTFYEPFLFLLPFLLGIAVFTLYPFVNVILISFKEGYKMLTREFTAWGFKNYEDVISDPNFLNGLKNTALYTLFVVPIATALSLFIANMLNKDIRLKGLFQTCYFLPMVTSITAVGLVWKWLFNYDYGLINYLITLFGGTAINWLNNPVYNLPALILYGIWSMIPFTTILLLAGLFIVIGSLTYNGIIDDISQLLVNLGGSNLFLMYSLIVWASVLFSAFIDNIPYVATMLPVVAGIAARMGCDARLLYFGLLVGATLGGNLTPIGASANIAAIGILQKEGYEVKASDFLKIGVPFTLLAVLTGYLYCWLVWA